MSDTGSFPVIVITAPDPPPAVFEQALNGFSVKHLPLIQVQGLPDFTLPADPPDWVLWTSKRAVAAVLPVWPAHWAQVKHAVLGDKEAQALQAVGLTPQWQSPVPTGTETARHLARHVGQPSVIWWPCGNLANPDIQTLLASAGHNCYPTVVYQTTTVDVALSQAEQQTISGWVFTSPSAVKAFVRNGFVLQPHQWTAAFGPTTTQAVVQYMHTSPVQGSRPSDWSALAEAINVKNI